MTTFSQLVDKMISETKRPDMIAEIATYVNQTLRELHFEPQRGNAVFLRENMKEDQITSLVETGLTWAIPDPTVFQGLQAVRFDSVFIDDQQSWPEEVTVGRGMTSRTEGWYRAGGNVFFFGYGGINGRVSLAWYEYVKALKYYTVDTRPASYDIESGWSYKSEFNTSDEQRALAQRLTSNWILLRWDSVVEEGVRAKIYKRTSDTERARTSYSMYSTLRQGFISSESAVISGAW